jgi:hypothetical protein
MRRYINIILLCFCVYNIIKAQSTVKEINGLLSEFDFDNGSCKDKNGNNEAKAHNASLTKDRFGNKNAAVFLHGTAGSYINLGTGNNLKPKVGSISLWVRVDNFMPNGVGVRVNPIIVTRANKNDDFNEAYAIVYEFTSRKLAIAAGYSEEQQVAVYSSDSIVLNQWHHVDR